MVTRFFCSFRQRNDRIAFLALLVVFLIGAELRFFEIGQQPLWMDEAYSVWMATNSLPRIVQYMIEIDQHPPVYYFLLHLWMKIGWAGEAWVRSLSALMGIGTLIAIFFLGKTLSGWRVGFLSALILAFSPFHVQYSQEARSYTMLTLFACLSMWMTARLLLDSNSHNLVIGQQLKNSLTAWKVRQEPVNAQRIATDLSWLGYMVFTAFTVYAHNTALFLPFGINLFVFALMLLRRFALEKEGQIAAPSLMNWLVAQLGMFLIWIPWIYPYSIQLAGVYNTFWIQKPTLTIVIDALKSFLMAWLPNRIQWQWAVWGGFGGFFLLALVKFRKLPGRFLFLLILFLAPFLGELLISFWRPIFYDRTLIWCTIPLYVLVAAGISQLRHRSYILSALIILVTLSLLSLKNYYTYFEKERWDLAAAYVNEKYEQGDIILFNAGWSEIPFTYYFQRYQHEEERFGLPSNLFENGELEPRMQRADIPRLRDIIQGRRRVWLVYAHNWWTDPNSLIPQTLEKDLILEKSHLFNGMQVLLYVAR